MESKGIPSPKPAPHQTVIIAEEQAPVPVTIAPPEPASPPVLLTEAQVAASPHLVTSGQGTVAAPTTTEEEQAVTAGQRRISQYWEITQSVLSVMITSAVIYAELTGITSITLGNAFFFVVSLYLIRTNHQKIGGEGAKANETPYRGR